MTRAATPADVLSGAARWACLVGDVRESLRALPDASVQCVVTSPPYWGLRDYGTASWEGGDPACDHAVRRDPKVASSTLSGGKATTGHQCEGHRVACPRCGARRVDAQIGMEPTPAAYVETMRALFAEIRRVLRDDGTVWLNLGDSYAATTKGSGGKGKSRLGPKRDLQNMDHQRFAPRRFDHDVKPKDLIGIPWRVAFALQDDGWWLRSDIVWSKPNPMPESVTDRPTRAHEYVFLLAKSARYFYGAEAIREPGTGRASGSVAPDKSGAADGFEIRAGFHKVGDVQWHERNARSVWTITPEPFKGAHFATMPPELARRCILAGSRKGDVVLDPFGGSGTTALVAVGHHRRAILCELSERYAALQRERLATVDTDFAVPVPATSLSVTSADDRQLSLLGGAL